MNKVLIKEYTITRPSNGPVRLGLAYFREKRGININDQILILNSTVLIATS